MACFCRPAVASSIKPQIKEKTDETATATAPTLPSASAIPLMERSFSKREVNPSRIDGSIA